MLTVVNTLTDQVDEDISVDLFQQSFGFEPLNVVVLPSDVDADGGHIVAVIGFNWDKLAGEILTYAPNTTLPSRKFQGALRLPDLELTGPVAVSGTTSTMWVLGKMQAGAGIAMVDPLAGSIAGPELFGPDGVNAAMTEVVSEATDIYANNDHFYVAFPHLGVGAFGAPTDTTQIYNPEDARLTAFDGARKIAPLISGGGLDSLLVTRTEAGKVARVQPGLGEVDVGFMSTVTEPTLIHTFSNHATDGTL